MTKTFNHALLAQVLASDPRPGSATSSSSHARATSQLSAPTRAPGFATIARREPQRVRSFANRRRNK